jgi:predicted dehydrogenase
MTDTIRWGILGTGKIARAFANALKDTPDATLAAVASRSSANAVSFGAEFGAAQTYGSYEALAAAPDIDTCSTVARPCCARSLSPSTGAKPDRSSLWQGKRSCS